VRGVKCGLKKSLNAQTTEVGLVRLYIPARSGSLNGPNELKGDEAQRASYPNPSGSSYMRPTAPQSVGYHMTDIPTVNKHRP